MPQLEVSLGEAIDKLTILAIKLEKIKDERRDDVKREYDIIYNTLSEYLPKIRHFYKQLYEVNLELWELQDEVRDIKRDDPIHLQKCLKILDDNDRRFRIKNKINYLTKSLLKEQKGYRKKKVLFASHYGLGDIINFIGAIRYISTEQDEVKVLIDEGYKSHFETIFGDDPTIQPICVNKNTYDMYIQGMNIINNLQSEYTIIKSGIFSDKSTSSNNNYPLNLYDELNIDQKIYKSYFYMNFPEESKALLSKLQNNPYMFVVDRCSNSGINIIDPNSTDLLCINPNRNMYDLTTRFLVSNKVETYNNFYDDRFDIKVFYIDDNTCNISIKRIDKTEDWGQNLNIALYSEDNKEREIINIGSKKILYNYKTNIKLKKSDKFFHTSESSNIITIHPKKILNTVETKAYQVDCFYIDKNTIDIQITRTDDFKEDLEISIYSLDNTCKEVINIGKSHKILGYKLRLIEVAPYPESKNHTLFKEIASHFVNRPFFEYKDTIENAVESYLIDSSFCCLCSFLELKANKKIIYSRNLTPTFSKSLFNGWVYSYIYPN